VSVPPPDSEVSARRISDDLRSASRDEEHLLAGRQVADQPVELRHAIDEGARRHDLAIDKGIGHYVNVCNDYVISRNMILESEDIRD